MKWSPRQVRLLKVLWSERMPSREIAGALGTTRNAVIGKAHRLHLEDHAGLIPGPGAYTFEETCDIVRLRRQGWLFNEIAKVVHHTPDSLCGRYNRVMDNPDILARVLDALKVPVEQATVIPWSDRPKRGDQCLKPGCHGQRMTPYRYCQSCKARMMRPNKRAGQYVGMGS